MVFTRQSIAASPVTPPVLNGSHGFRILVIISSFTACAVFTFGARLYVRAVILKTVGIDDCFMIIATLTLDYASSIFVLISFVIQVHLGIGEHVDNPKLLSNFTTIMHWSYHHAWVIVTGISCVKLSVGFFLLRLVQKRWYKRFITAWISFLVLFSLGSVGTLVFQCDPISAAWDSEQRSSAKCYSVELFRAIGLSNGAVNIFTDFLFATLPIPVIWPLQLNRRTKLSLICVLSLGYFACAAAIVREVLLSTFFSNTDFSFNDSFQVWAGIELTMGILAACLPALRPLCVLFLDYGRTSTQRLRSRVRQSLSPKHPYHTEYDMKFNSLSSLSRGRKSGYGVSVVVRGGQDADLERSSGWREPQSSKSSSGTGLRETLELNLERNESWENIIVSAQKAHLAAASKLQEIK